MEANQGWRQFSCDCGHTFDLPTRYAKSLSGESCPECGEWCTPINHRIDPTLPIDDFGNLINNHT